MAGLLSAPAAGPLGAAPAGLRVTVLDVGQGDSILVQAPGANVLVDQAEPQAQRGRPVASAGRRQGRPTRVQSPPARSPRRRGGGFLERVRWSRASSTQVWAVESRDYDEALVRARERDVPVVIARQGMSFSAGPLRIEVLWPASAGSPADDPNGPVGCPSRFLRCRRRVADRRR